ncbi:MAG TPA: hypothetical protein VI756_00645, partial [Blastocatellia bacterium]
ALALAGYWRRTGRRRLAPAGLAVAAFGLWNLAFFIGPSMHMASDPLIAAAKAVAGRWNTGTVVYYAPGSPIDGAFRYFNEETEWRGLSPRLAEKLDEQIELIREQGGNVWLDDAATKTVKPEWLSRRARGQELTVRLGDQSYHYVELLPPD